MPKPDKTVFVVDTPINDPEEKTITSFTLAGEGSRLIIESSRPLRCDELLHKLRSSWDMLSGHTRSTRERTA